MLKTVGGADYDAPLNQIRSVAPDLARFTVEFCYGDVMPRNELDLPTRQLCTVAALTGMGNAMPQLKVYISAALNADKVKHPTDSGFKTTDNLIWANEHCLPSAYP